MKTERSFFAVITSGWNSPAIIVPGFTVISSAEIPLVPSFSRQPAKAGIKNRNAIATESKRFIVSPEEQ
jgi:hypothetical protein